MKKVLVVVAVCVLGSFFAIACGGGNSESATPASPTAPSDSAAPAGDSDAGAPAAPAAS